MSLPLSHYLIPAHSCLQSSLWLPVPFPQKRVHRTGLAQFLWGSGRTPRPASLWEGLLAPNNVPIYCCALSFPTTLPGWHLPGSLLAPLQEMLLSLCDLLPAISFSKAWDINSGGCSQDSHWKGPDSGSGGGVGRVTPWHGILPRRSLSVSLAPCGHFWDPITCLHFPRAD